MGVVPKIEEQAEDKRTQSSYRTGSSPPHEKYNSAAYFAYF